MATSICCQEILIMPAYTRGVKNDQLRFVTPAKNSLLRYGFKTKDFGAVQGAGSQQAIESQLGHLKITAASSGNTILIFRANSPKPPRVRKILDRSNDPKKQGSISTFCSADKLAAAQTSAGGNWALADTGRNVGGGGGKSQLAVVPTANGALYAFPLNKNDYSNYSSLIGVKTTLTDTDRRNMFAGASSPKPAVMSVFDSTRQGYFSTFVADDKQDALLKAGWQIVEAAVPPIA